MKEKNRKYILSLDVQSVPWHRLTTAYGRATNFPVCFSVLQKMNDMKAVKE